MRKIVKTNTSKGRNIVFMVASPRSGTTWLTRMLAASSPQIRTGPETFLFRNYLSSLNQAWENGNKQKRYDLHNYFKKKEFVIELRKFANNLLERIDEGSSKNSLFIEKTNTHALNLKLIREVFPESKIIYIIRDPRDVVASCMASTRTWAKGEKPNTARSFAKLWKECFLSFENAKKNISPEQYYELSYEELIEDTPGNLDNVLSFLGIKVDSKKLSKVVSDHTIDKMKKGSSYHKLTLKGEVGGEKGKTWNEPPGFFRKGKVGSWKHDLGIWEKFQVWVTVRELMQKINYND